MFAPNFMCWLGLSKPQVSVHKHIQWNAERKSIHYMSLSIYNTDNGNIRHCGWNFKVMTLKMIRFSCKHIVNIDVVHSTSTYNSVDEHVA